MSDSETLWGVVWEGRVGAYSNTYTVHVHQLLEKTTMFTEVKKTDIDGIKDDQQT